MLSYEKLSVWSTILSTGKTLAFTRVDFTNSSGELVAYGRELD